MTDKDTRSKRYNNIGHSRAFRILSNAFGAKSFGEVAQRIGWSRETLFQLLRNNPDIYDTVRYLIALARERDIALRAVRWADGLRKRLR